jgi:hypothetical protein
VFLDFVSLGNGSEQNGMLWRGFDVSARCGREFGDDFGSTGI